MSSSQTVTTFPRSWMPAAASSAFAGTDLERLTKDDLEAIADWLRGAAFTPKRKDPQPHQSEALEAILAGLEKHDRVTAVMACGTGKTLVSLWLAERMKAKRILVLVPSLALIRQTLHEWLKETAWEQPRFIAVCSDPTVTTRRGRRAHRSPEGSGLPGDDRCRRGA